MSRTLAGVFATEEAPVKPPPRRINLRIYLTLRPEARAALVYLGATKGTQSAITSDALVALACARGWRPGKGQGETPPK